MGFFDEIKKLTQPYGDEDEDIEAEPESAPAPKRQNPFSTLGTEPQPARSSAQPQRAPQTARGGKVVPLGGSSQHVVVKPERFESAAEIAGHLIERRQVTLNLENTSKDVSRRLIDFLSGVVFALDGTIEKVSSATYLLAPNGVELIGDVSTESVDNSGMYF